MEIVCTQCGAQVTIGEDTDFIRCSFCDTALYVDAEQTVRHYVLEVLRNADDLPLLIKRSLSYMEIKDPVAVRRSNLIYFPFWRLVLASGYALALPAANPPCEDLADMKMPAGKLRRFSAEAVEGRELIEPDVMVEDAKAAAAQLIDQPEPKFESASLCQIPFYRVEYRCQERDHFCLVSAVSGEVFADEWPAAPQKDKDRALGMIAAAALILFLLAAALIPGFWPVLAAYLAIGSGIYFVSRKMLRNLGW